MATASICFSIVKSNADNRLYSDVKQIPHNKVGLLLGTAPVTPWGVHNNYYDYRINAAIELFKAGKIDYILVSGDNHSTDYDEPSCMRDSLLVKGVPKDKIILDYAGFRTLDSVVRAKEIFGQDSITIISQSFHNERALYLAKHYGIEAVGYNAKDVEYWKKKLKIHGREYLARVKMFIDLYTGKQPKFLGEKIKIE
ncbi:ElyC/SanA/YdcF family protein [uncultured Muribaculum sp.]|nr:ElyC/SanA/YdcF family protein [uncultured Muribaculum sp.]